MADFSPSLQDRLSLVPAQYVREPGKPVQKGEAFRFSGTLSEFLAFSRDAIEDRSPAGYRFAYRCGTVSDTPSWAGFRAQKWSDFLTSGYSADALSEFNKAVARLNAVGSPSRPEFRVTGGVWSVPRYLSGHPQCAIYRPRTALPPKHWEFSIRYAADVAPATAARTLAKIARAAWGYIERGGPLKITVCLAGGFSLPWHGATGWQIRLNVNPANMAELATVFSINLRRTLAIAFGRALSGQSDDILPPYYLSSPGMCLISGDEATDTKALQALGII